ncbi:phage tail protein [Robbsia andropogonis]|uniref:phage tail protein n=1 Tax=Robbsia andropogonis TaxID=28092 RepID=UPI00209CAA1F|nr:phage tail protein [Robbsia andropogonis]MCP1116939.1 phage tail protein [Robbsia andropogonis]MCP1126382.1 phage tail protein [Robbsia andropogonis]
MAEIVLTLTKRGRNALLNAARDGTTARRVSYIGLASAAFAASDEIDAVPSEHKRLTTFAGDNVGDDTIHITIQDVTHDQYSLFGFGLYLDDGTLLGSYSQERAILEKAPSAILLLTTDIRLTEIGAATLTFGDTTFLNPPATTERQGVVELATAEEAAAGADNQRALTPAVVRPLLERKASLSGARFTGPVTMSEALQFEVHGGANHNHIGPGSDGATNTANNIAIRSWWGVGIGPSCNAGSVPMSEFSHWFDARNGDATFRGRLFVDDHIQTRTRLPGDASKCVATTEFVTSAIRSACVGQIFFEARADARAGDLKLCGLLISRADFPALWTYAQQSGALVSDEAWQNGRQGCFSHGDGVSTFRIPDVRGEFLRALDNDRGVDPDRQIGSRQDSQNKAHAHTATTAPAGTHGHGGHTDVQGLHSHGVSRHGFIHGIDQGRDGAEVTNAGSGGPAITSAEGAHAHHLIIHAAPDHQHPVTVAAEGGHESRPPNVAFLAVIRAL